MTPRVSHPSRPGRIGLCFFGLVFLGAGLAMGYFFVLSDLRLAADARNYLPVQAELLHVELKSNRGKNSTTYETTARYRYTVGERNYTSERVGVGDGADNIGSYQRDLYEKLNTAKLRHTTITAWVNPANPHEALLDRGMRWGLFALKGMFFFVFTLVGLGVSVYAIRALPATRNVASDEHWLTNPAWRDGRVTSGSRTGVIGMWGLAVLWNAISAPLLFMLPAELAKQNWPALLGLLFPIAGLWLFFIAVHKTLQWRRFGALVLTMHPFPGIVGGAVSGAIDLPERFRPGQTFRISLTCIHRLTSGNRNRNRSERAVWQNEISTPVEMSGRGSRVTFRFAVPADLPPTARPSDSYHYWAVHLIAELDGVDLDHQFEIPVAAAIAGATVTAAAAPAPTAPVPEIPADVVRIYRQGGSTVFYYPLFRHPSLGIGLLVFSMIFAGSTIFLYGQTSGFAGLITGFMALVFGAVAIGMMLFALYQLGNTLRVEVSPRGLTAIRRILGIAFTTHISLDDIAGIESKIGSQSKSGNKFSIRYTLHVLRHAGRRVAVGDDIPGQPLADHVAELLRGACGIRSTRS